MNRLVAWLYRRGSAKMVRRSGGQDYLFRVYLLRLGWRFAAFFHTFYMDDPDPLHNHPWDWGRVILRGRYREHYLDGTWVDCGPGHVVWNRPAETYHRVELLTPSVSTVFWHRRRRRIWGFIHDGVFSPAPEEGQDGRPWVGVLLPRKMGRPPKEIVHGA